jgi:rhodanese-related sulfurtransferase
MSVLMVVNIILIIILAGILLYELYVKIMVKRSATVLTEDEFRKNMRKAQVIDVREKNIFDEGHILGARNIPYTMLKTNLTSIRKDQPVYLYEQRKALSARAANLLRKNGYKDIYILKGGYEEWTGKIKKKNA